MKAAVSLVSLPPISTVRARVTAKTNLSCHMCHTATNYPSRPTSA